MDDDMDLMPEDIEDMEPTDAVSVVQETLDKFLDSANVYAVYGEPVHSGDTVIIPTAEVLSGLGFGIGYGSGVGTAQDEDEKEVENKSAPVYGSGGGGGGGGRVLSRPVAVIIASPEGVRVEPVVDVTKIGIAALTAFGFIYGMMSRMNRRRA
jgi:uncharacterized spore protein YtfJ